MKKILLTMLVIGLFLMGGGLAHAQGTVVQSAPVILHDSATLLGSLGPDPKYMVSATLLADSSAHIYPAFVINGTCSAPILSAPYCISANILRGWYLFKVEALAGTPAPTTGWTATVTDASGYDFCAGKITGTNSTTIPVMIDCYPSGQTYMFVNGPMTVTVSGNSVNSAYIYMTFYFLPR